VTTSNQDDQADRKATFENDRRVREQGSTLHDHARASIDDEAGGRFAKVSPSTVIGSTPLPRYPQLPSGPWSGEDLVGTEPPLGFRVDDMVPLERAPVPPVAASEATGPTADAPVPSPCGDAPVGPLPPTPPMGTAANPEPPSRTPSDRDQTTRRR
jgi:hypothetical protein